MHNQDLKLQKFEPGHSLSQKHQFSNYLAYTMMILEKSYISHICNNLSRSLAIIHKLRPLVNKKWAINLCNIFFVPSLTYCCSIWAASGKSNLKGIDKLQHRAMKTILILPVHTPSAELHQELKVLKITDRDYQHLIDLYKVVNSLANISEYLLPKIDMGHRLIRRNDEFYLPVLRLSVSQISYLYQTPKLRYALPITVRSKKSSSAFKSALKYFLLHLTDLDVS